MMVIDRNFSKPANIRNYSLLPNILLHTSVCALFQRATTEPTKPSLLFLEFHWTLRADNMTIVAKPSLSFVRIDSLSISACFNPGNPHTVHSACWYISGILKILIVNTNVLTHSSKYVPFRTL